jgi:hypothetical protein
MELWKQWFEAVSRLRVACSRTRTFMWLSACLAGMTVRGDLLGVTSIVRGLGLEEKCYDRILDFLHSPALDLEKLTRSWVETVFEVHPDLLRINGRPVLVGDGIKVAKSGKKMPGVKLLHQESESNTKPEYIMGHSCQAIAVLGRAMQSFFAIPLCCRIHEGVVFSNRDQRTLLDKMVEILGSLELEEECYFVADAYYASGKVVKGLLARGHHLVTLVRKNAVAYEPATPPQGPRRPGRPRKYGAKVYLRSLLEDVDAMEEAVSPVYREKNVTIRYRTLDLLWRPVGIMVRFVLVVHPTRGVMILMCTDLTLSALEIIRIYGLRFKIEVAFKQALRTMGAYAYHFWMRTMTPIKRISGDQHLHRKNEKYRAAVKRKIEAYHRHIQIGLIAQGLLQCLASNHPKTVWANFGSWIRTIRPGIPPSEQVTAIAMKNTLPEFIADSSEANILAKFLREKIDISRCEGLRMIAVNE